MKDAEVKHHRERGRWCMVVAGLFIGTKCATQLWTGIFCAASTALSDDSLGLEQNHARWSTSAAAAGG